MEKQLYSITTVTTKGRGINAKSNIGLSHILSEDFQRQENELLENGFEVVAEHNSGKSNPFYYKSFRKVNVNVIMEVQIEKVKIDTVASVMANVKAPFIGG